MAGSPAEDRPDGVERSPSDRAADHAAIDRLTDELLPALILKLGATGLGEIEVRDGTWRVRLRRPADASDRAAKGAERASRTQPGHAGHGHAPGAIEGHRAARTGGATGSTNGSGPGGVPVGPGRTGVGTDDHRAVATSPAVGVFQPASTVRPGSRVRSGDRLGVVDMLGVPHEVVAPVDGIVGATLADPGEAVEYGQELVRIELAGASPASGDA